MKRLRDQSRLSELRHDKVQISTSVRSMNNRYCYRRLFIINRTKIIKRTLERQKIVGPSRFNNDINNKLNMFHFPKTNVIEIIVNHPKDKRL